MRGRRLLAAGVLVAALTLSGGSAAQQPGDATVREQAEVSVKVQLALGLELKRRGFPTPPDKPLGDAADLERVLRQRTGQDGPSKRAAAGYRWGTYFASTHETTRTQLILSLFAMKTLTDATVLKDVLLLADQGTGRRIAADGGKVEGEKLTDVSPTGSNGGYALERTVVLPGQTVPLCMDKVVVSAGSYVLEVGLVGPVEAKDVKLLKTVTSAALRALAGEPPAPR